jgi:hypothetical protein
MLPRVPRNLRIALLTIFVCCAPPLKAALSTGRGISAQPRGEGPGGAHLAASGLYGRGILLSSVRYHFGDDPDGKLGWANPGFDDQSWPVAEQVRWPMPAFSSDGFMWVRARMTVPGDAAGPIALCLSQDTFSIADEVFVNGKQVGHQGRLPPQSELILFPQDAVFDLPAGEAAPGATLVVAFRAWYPPFIRTFGWFGFADFILDESRNLRLAVDADRAATLLKWGPTLALNVLIGFMGLGLLAFWRWTRTREILLCSALLIVYPLFQLMHDLGVLGLLTLSFELNTVIYIFLQAAGMAITVEFIWEVHGLRALWLKRLAQAALIVFNVGGFFGQLATTPSTFDRLSLPAGMLALAVFDIVTFGVNVWAIFNRRRTRLIAAALALIPCASSMLWLGNAIGGTFGMFHIEYLDLAFFVSALALFFMLGQSAWAAWRARDELRIEFEAAREVQQQLVAPVVDVPGFKIDSIYAPAKQVGGDFFLILPDDNGSLMIVVGDVSGKGLRAAMTVSAIIGALRTIVSESPAEILRTLNRGLAGHLHGGFVTCCAAWVAHNGQVIIANAGHIPPYLEGAEVDTYSGLPLGIDSECVYAERQFLFGPAESLTFLSDGVVEARNPSGELFGFDRTLKIIKLSRSAADAIAKAAVEFGQDDDITVLTLTRLAV